MRLQENQVLPPSLLKILSEMLSGTGNIPIHYVEIKAPNDAEVLLELSKKLAQVKKCQCQMCQMKWNLLGQCPPALKELANQFAASSVGLQFKALSEEMSFDQIRKELEKAK